jgi:hypothetical protein
MKYLVNIIVFIAAFTGSYIVNRLVFEKQQKSTWKSLLYLRNKAVDFRIYQTKNSNYQATEEYKQSCMNFYKLVQADYKKNENSEFAFCYKLFLDTESGWYYDTGICSSDKMACFIEVLNRILEQLEERINKRSWLFVKIFGPSGKQR